MENSFQNESQMQSTVLMKIAKIGSILLSIILCVLGILRIIMPQFPKEKFSVICGIVFIAFGCIRIIGFYSKDLFRLAFQYDLEFGILLIILGILICIRPESFFNKTCVVLGILVIADALFKIRITLDAKKFGIEQWCLILIIAIIASALGIILVFYLGDKINLIIGIILIVEGLLSLCTVLALVKIVNNQIKE